MTGVSENPISISEGQTATAPTPPTLAGYNFVAWYTEEAATNPYDFSQVITSSIDLYAKWNIQQYTITYHGNKPQDVTANVTGLPDPVNIDYNQPATVPTPPTLTGYNFVGWYTEATATNQFNFSQVITANIDLYAKWSQDPVVTFDTQRGSTIEPQRLTGTIKRATRPDNDPTREDYTFDNWYTTADTGTTQFNFDQDITAQSTIVYARWNRIARTVTYHGNKPDTVPEGVSVTNLPDPATVNVNSGETTTAPTAKPELQDYDFQGWFVGTTTGTILRLENTAFAFETTAIKADLHLYAKWSRTQITVTFHGRKPSTAPTDATITGLTTDPTIVTINSGDRTTALKPPPELTGYTLDGWFIGTTSGGTLALQDTAFDFTQPVRGENINLYTKWLQQFTVTYHGNKPGDAPEGVTVTGVPENPVSISDGQTAKAPTSPTLADYNFVGWYTEATATNQFNFSQVITANIDLYAKWTQDPVVTFDTQRGSTIEPQRLTGTIKRATRPQENPTREDYTFENWYTMATGGALFDFDQDITAQSTIVYARWNRIMRTVTYHGNKPDTVPEGVSVSNLPDPATVNVDSGETTTAPIPAPELQDYVFQGWFAGTTGTTPMIGNTAFVFETTAIKENKDLYAKWTRKEINITFYGNKPSTAPEDATITGLTTDPTIITVNSGETTTALSPPPELAGYTLDGWFVGFFSSGTLLLSQYAFDFERPVRSENINLYAKWTKYPIVTFDTQGGSTILSQTITRPSTTMAMRPTEEPTREDYTFNDWYDMATGGDVFDFSTTITSNLTVYAQWTRIQKTITYHGNKPDTVPRGVSISNLLDPVNVNIGDTATPPTPKPVLQDYVFQGWFAGITESTAFAFETTAIKENKDLYAKWTRKEINITFYGNKPDNAPEGETITGLATDPTIITVNSGETTTALKPPPELTGYTLDGWFIGTISEGTLALQDTAFDFTQPVRGENINLYAKWTKHPVVTFDTQGGSTILSQTINRPTTTMAIRPTDDPTRDDYTFNDWYDMATGGDVFDFSTTITASITVYAQWEFRPSTKAELVAEINNAITTHGNNVDLNYIDTSLITDMSSLFELKFSFNGDISGWNVSNVENMSGMFNAARVFNGNISSWNVAKVINMSNMFNSARAFSQNISSWNVAKVINMSNMFLSASVFNQNLSSWNVSLVQNMNSMFYNARAFNQNISSWNVAMVIDMANMFRDATVFNGNISDWRPTALTNMSNMFNNASAFTQNINSWNIASSVDKTDAFLNSDLAENLPSWATP